MSKQVIQQLRNGILPTELNFNLDNQTKDIDWTKVQYNTFYKNPSYLFFIQIST